MRDADEEKWESRLTAASKSVCFRCEDLRHVDVKCLPMQYHFGSTGYAPVQRGIAASVSVCVRERFLGIRREGRCLL